MNPRFLFAVAFAGLTANLSAAPLIVHEWGTFTSLQDESGRTLSRINTDDEPVPPFCHDLAPRLILNPGVAAWGLSQGGPRGHREVTMRLETPVLYFHLPKDARKPLTASVKVTFRGGWLTQFYPRALASGFLENSGEFENLSEETTGTLKWENLTIGSDGVGPATTERVWTAPRAVKAATVTTKDNESEKFLFYRGLGHLLCPLQVARTADSKTLECRSQLEGKLAGTSPMKIRRLWLASFREDGGCAFRVLPSCELSARKGANGERPVLFSTPAEFAARDYSLAKLDKLRAEMRGALMEEGLFGDEADALLNTWELSYFKSAGLRLFFMVPRAWTDFHLPLEISVPAEVKRAMVGRLELVTPAQRELLAQLAHAPTPTQAWVHPEVKNNWLALMGTPPPLYRDLGRFRQALLLDEYGARPTPSLTAFINLNQLWPDDRPRQLNDRNDPAETNRTSALSGRLHSAASSGEVDIIASLLAEGADPNTEGYLHMRPLASMAMPGGQRDDKVWVEIAKMLLAHGAVLDAKDDNGVTALYWAVEAGRTNLVRFLLEQGADPGVAMQVGVQKGRTPLHDAAADGRTEIVELLLKFKAPPNPVDHDGATPLLLAEGRDHKETAQMLRKALQASGQSAPPEAIAGPTKEAMRELAKRIARGDDAAYDELAAAARDLYRGIDYQKEGARVRMNLFKMKAAFDVLGEEAGKGNEKAMAALKHCLRDRSSHLSSFAPDALGIAAAAGQEEALNILLHHKDWDILDSTTVFSMAAAASANREPAVDFMISWLSDPQHRSDGMSLSAAESLKQAAAKGNQQARTALAKYEANSEPK